MALRRLAGSVAPRLAVPARGLRVAHGGGGRSSVSGFTVTVFGCTGFMGRYVVNRFGKIGSQVVAPFRGDDNQPRHLKLMGDLGQIVPMHYDPNVDEHLARAVEHSNVVVNLVGREFETKNYSFQDVHAAFAGRLARVCKQQGVDRLIHMSTLKADPARPYDSDSRWVNSKSLGEVVVREEFPEATILRPSWVFGSEDRYINCLPRWMRNLPAVPVLNYGQTRWQPVYVGDVASAVLSAADDASTAGKTYELTGRDVYSMNELLEEIRVLLKEEHVRTLPLPYNLVHAYASVMETLSTFPWITTEYVYQLTQDCVSTNSLPGLADLGIDNPVLFRDLALVYMRRFRKPLEYLEI